MVIHTLPSAENDDCHFHPSISIFTSSDNSNICSREELIYIFVFICIVIVLLVMHLQQLY